MSFFYNDAKKEGRAKAPPKPRLADIPITTIRQMGCKACPRDNDTSLRSPKLKPEGRKEAAVYLLGTSPSREDDEDDVHWADKFTGEVYDKFTKDFMREHVRSNYIMQCRHGERETEADAVMATECCRSRIIADIEATKPKIVVTIGDAPLRWATGIGGTAPQFRGALFAARFGSHVCLVLPIIYPNYVSGKWGKRGRTNANGRSTFEVCLDFDTKRVRSWVREDNFPRADFQPGPYDAGIELLTGDQPGDIIRLEKRLVEIARYPRSALDIETTGLRPYMLRDPRILTAAVGTFEDTLAFPIEHPDGWATTRPKQRAMELFAEYLLHSGRKACHQLTFEQEWIEAKMGAYFLRRTEWDDTMAQSFVLDGRPGTKGLDMQCRMLFGFPLKDQSPVDVSRPEWWTLYSLRETLRYNGMDTKWTDRLRDRLDERLDVDDNENGDLRWQYEGHVRLAPTLVLTTAPGLAVDFDYARKLDGEMRDTMARVEKELLRCTEILDYERKYSHFSPTNPDHVLRLMKDMLDRPEVRREDRDKNVTYTTDEEALSAIPRSEVPSARLILEHREVAKLHSTYVSPVLEKKIVCKDSMVRSRYSSLVASTNRLASEDPNIQNFPKRKHKYVRGMIVPERDFLLPCDYGQIEFRVVGMASRDKNLVKYCWTGYDVHKYWAQRMIAEYGPIVDWIRDDFADNLAELKAKAKKGGMGWDEDAAILKLLRQESKNKWVFPQLFGATTYSCAQNLHLPQDVADELGGEFWDEFQGVKRWQEEVGRFYEKHLYVETLNGHRRRGAMTANEMVNLPIQGTAAEIVKAAQNALSERADATGDIQYQPRINVHDDLTFDLSKDGIDERVQTIVREMCKPRFDFINVPLVVEVSKGTRWDNTEEIGVYRSHEVFGTPNPYKEP